MVEQQKELIALQQFKQLLLDRKRSESHDSISDEIYFCGVRLELEAINERTDVILLKFLRAKYFEVEDAFKMLSRAIIWRKKFGIDKLHLEDEDHEYSNIFGRAFFMSGRSREGHPVLYMVCGAFLDKELYDEAFSEEAKKQRFLKWRTMFIEKTMRKLDFRAGGISSIVLVIDMENSIDLERTAFEALKSVNSSLLNYYPEFVERRILINVSWMDMALMTIRRPLSASGKFDKVVFARGSGCRETLLRYVGEEQKMEIHLPRNEKNTNLLTSCTNFIVANNPNPKGLTIGAEPFYRKLSCTNDYNHLWKPYSPQKAIPQY